MTTLKNYYNITPEQVQEEVNLLNLQNIRTLPITRSKIDDFYSMWQRFGPAAARTYMIPTVWTGKSPLPSEFFKSNG